MPRYILKRPSKPPGYDKLVAKLVAELKSDDGGDVQPLILEQVIDATKSRHIHVIWDEWKNISEEHRYDAIVDAYTAAEGTEVAEEITLASGATPQEALVLGLLPYKVVLTGTTHEGGSTPGKLENALKAEAGNTVLGSRADKLRYARLEDAEDAKKRLEQSLPDSHWSIVQETPIEY